MRLQNQILFREHRALQCTIMYTLHPSKGISLRSLSAHKPLTEDVQGLCIGFVVRTPDLLYFVIEAILI